MSEFVITTKEAKFSRRFHNFHFWDNHPGCEKHQIDFGKKSCHKGNLQTKTL